jgi:chromosome segregation ATPase
MSSNESNEAYQLREDLAVAKADLRHAERTISNLQFELDQLRTTSTLKDKLIDRKDDEFQSKNAELHRVTMSLAVTKEKLRQTESALAQRNQRTRNKKISLRLQAFLSSVLYLLATILTSIGINMVTSSRPNSLGVTMIVLGDVPYRCSHDNMDNHRGQ